MSVLEKTDKDGFPIFTENELRILKDDKLRLKLQHQEFYIWQNKAIAQHMKQVALEKRLSENRSDYVEPEKITNPRIRKFSSLKKKLNNWYHNG